MALRLEAIAIRLEEITLRLEAIALRLEVITIRLEAIAIRLEEIALRLEAIAIEHFIPNHVEGMFQKRPLFPKRPEFHGSEVPNAMSARKRERRVRVHRHGPGRLQGEAVLVEQKNTSMSTLVASS